MLSFVESLQNMIMSRARRSESWMALWVWVLATCTRKRPRSGGACDAVYLLGDTSKLKPKLKLNQCNILKKDK